MGDTALEKHKQKQLRSTKSLREHFSYSAMHKPLTCDLQQQKLGRTETEL